MRLLLGLEENGVCMLHFFRNVDAVWLQICWGCEGDPLRPKRDVLQIFLRMVPKLVKMMVFLLFGGYLSKLSAGCGCFARVWVQGPSRKTRATDIHFMCIATSG